MRITASVQEVSRGDYVVKTNLPPNLLSELTVAVFHEWVRFASGNASLNGRKIMHPTGRYAASIQYQGSSDGSAVAIFADESIAPEAGILETGHAQFDLKTKFAAGRAYPMHRGGAFAAGRGGKVWAEAREGGFTGFAKVGATGWILPEMPAYSPAKIMADLTAKAARSMGA